MARFALLCLSVFGLTSCATVGEQSRAVVYQTPAGLSRAAEIPAVPYIRQTQYYCGPSTLAMVMQWSGRAVTVDEIAPQVFSAGGKGSLQNDLISASRRQGFMALPINGMEALIKEVAAGHPVIVLENLGFSWYPLWHYSLVYGYDLDQQKLIMHSGETSSMRKYLNHFERGWKMAGYWGLVVLPPDRLSATGGELEHVRSASGLESANREPEAARAYEKILERWPGNLAALIGLGNVAYKRKDFKSAVQHLEKAVQLYPDSAAAKHNLAVAREALKR